jgi:hypothetical protein
MTLSLLAIGALAFSLAFCRRQRRFELAACPVYSRSVRQFSVSQRAIKK